ncbi:MAG: hypothetical protein GY801_37010 [bacterium]|nr:hypothetical protein [bacterium]
MELSKIEAMASQKTIEELAYIKNTSPHGQFEIKEYIDFCFTCLSKTLPIEQQIALILKDIYAFKRKEILKIKMTRKRDRADKDDLYKLRIDLIRNIDPLHSHGSDFHCHHMEHTRNVAEKLHC